MTRSEIDTADRVRNNTSDAQNSKIDQEISRNVLEFTDKSKTEIDQRIRQLEKEWSIERKIETFASTLIVTGIGLAALNSKKWLFFPAVVAGFLFQHGVQGWCPPVPLFRALGTRTRKEIDWEKFTLKALRGDFNDVENNHPEEILEKVKSL